MVFPCVAEYINPPASSDDERRQIDVKFVMDELLRQVCAEEEAEEGHEFRVHASDEYYQENARPAREKFVEQQKYDIDEYWCAMHVLQTQYTLQLVRCNSVECCGPWRSNYVQVFPHRFFYRHLYHLNVQHLGFGWQKEIIKKDNFMVHYFNVYNSMVLLFSIHKMKCYHLIIVVHQLKKN